MIKLKTGVRTSDLRSPGQRSRARKKKGGPKFQESDTEGTFELERRGPFVLYAHHARMNDLAQGIANEIGKPVVDDTGLKGRYEIHLDLANAIALAMLTATALNIKTEPSRPVTAHTR